MFLSVAMCFKNESHILEEWINHYLDEGVDQFLLCDNKSTDSYKHILDKYDNIILYKDNAEQIQWNCMPPYGKYGKSIYSKMVTDTDTEWVIVADADEFMYAREGYSTIREFLKERGSEFDQLIVPNITFHNRAGTELETKEQPDSVIEHFVHGRKKTFLVKSIVRKDAVKNYKVHEHCVSGTSPRPHLKDDYDLSNTLMQASFSALGKGKREDGGEWRLYPDDGKMYIHCNHYRFQSNDNFFNVKKKRGYPDRDDAEAEKNMKRQKEWWSANSLNYDKDTELRDKKRGIKGN